MPRLLGPNGTGRLINVVLQEGDLILLPNNQARKSEPPIRVGLDLRREADHRDSLLVVNEDTSAPINLLIRRGFAFQVKEHAGGRRQRGDRDQDLGVFGSDLDDRPLLAITAFGAGSPGGQGLVQTGTAHWHRPSP